MAGRMHAERHVHTTFVTIVATCPFHARFVRKRVPTRLETCNVQCLAFPKRALQSPDTGSRAKGGVAAAIAIGQLDADVVSIMHILPAQVFVIISLLAFFNVYFVITMRFLLVS